jgi:hypothetical protein
MARRGTLVRDNADAEGHANDSNTCRGVLFPYQQKNFGGRGKGTKGDELEWHEDKPSFWSLKGSNSLAQGRAKRRPGFRTEHLILSPSMSNGRPSSQKTIRQVPTPIRFILLLRLVQARL